MTTALEQLLSRIHSGKKLKESELREVSDILRSIEFQEVGRKLSADDIYLLLSALSRDRRGFDEKLFERFFDFQDPTTASLVAKTLCATPQGRSDYVERLINFGLGSAWDSEGDVQQDAIELLSEFIKDESKSGGWSPRASKVVRFLFDLFDDDESSRHLKLWTYTALLRAGGVADTDLPSRYAMLDFAKSSKQVRWELLEQVRTQLSEES